MRQIFHQEKNTLSCPGAGSARTLHSYFKQDMKIIMKETEACIEENEHHL